MIPVGTDLRLKRLPAVTTSLIAVNVLVYAAGYASTSFFLNLFSHADIFHLLGNMLFLWVFGSYVEDRVGRRLFLFYYLLCYLGGEFLFRAMDYRDGLGASGAILGVMGLYLYRCYHSKIRTVVPIVTYVVRVSINAKWLLLLWFAWDVYDAFHTEDFIAHWAHIGGFLTGAAIGTVRSYGTQSAKEHFFERAVERMETEHDLEGAEKDLRKALELEPENPRIHLQLARLYAMDSDELEKAKKWYLHAAKVAYLHGGEKSLAGSIFVEYLARFGEPAAPELHLRYATALFSVCDYDGAVTLLRPFTEGREAGAFGSSMFLLHIRAALGAGLKEQAETVLADFRMAHPGSPLLREAEEAVREYKPGYKGKVEIPQALRPSWFARLRGKIDDVTTDPLYWIVLMGMMAIWMNLVGLLMGMYVIGTLMAMVTSFVTLLIAREVASLLGSIFEGTGPRRTDEEATREFNLALFRDKARLCVKEERYEEAVRYYRAVLEVDGKDIDAAYHIARLLHDKLDRPELALPEYRKLSAMLPSGHLYRREVFESLKELSGIGVR
jgi:membrane associated rhomboid family serine protease